MSLDVGLYKYNDDMPPPEACLTCITALDDIDHYHEYSVFDQNVTHNLGKMADAAGLYVVCWRPEELMVGPVYARDIAPILRDGISTLKADPAKFRALEPENKWGTYDKFIPWLERYLAACEEHPDARVKVSR